MNKDQQGEGGQGSEDVSPAIAEEEAPPLFDPDYDLITHIERGQGPQEEPR